MSDREAVRGDKSLPTIVIYVAKLFVVFVLLTPLRSCDQECSWVFSERKATKVRHFIVFLTGF